MSRFSINFDCSIEQDFKNLLQLNSEDKKDKIIYDVQFYKEKINISYLMELLLNLQVIIHNNILQKLYIKLDPRSSQINDMNKKYYDGDVINILGKYLLCCDNGKFSILQVKDYSHIFIVNINTPFSDIKKNCIDKVFDENNQYSLNDKLINNNDIINTNYNIITIDIDYYATLIKKLNKK